MVKHIRTFLGPEEEQPDKSWELWRPLEDLISKVSSYRTGACLLYNLNNVKSMSLRIIHGPPDRMIGSTKGSIVLLILEPLDGTELCYAVAFGTETIKAKDGFF